jgi:transposase
MRHLRPPCAYPDTWIAPVTATDERVRRLQSVPNIGPVTAAAFMAAIDEASRSRRGHEARPTWGLVPRELSSGETQRRGRINKAGSSRVRWLFIQAAVSMLRLRDPRTATPREWAGRITARRGKGITVVALARRTRWDSLRALARWIVYEPRRRHPCPVTQAVPV